MLYKRNYKDSMLLLITLISYMKERQLSTLMKVLLYGQMKEGKVG
jgi:hypothetical protein